jgi:hypothetical protein
MKVLQSWGIAGWRYDESAREIPSVRMPLNSNNDRRFMMKPGDSVEAIFEELRERAVAEFGERRAAELRDTLEQTARQIWEIDQVLVHVDLEPGFYQ